MTSSIICAIAAIALLLVSLTLLILSCVNGRRDQILGNGLSFIVDLLLIHGIYDALSAGPADSLLGEVVEGFSPALRIILVIVLLIISISRAYSYARIRRSALSPFSLGEALNNLPTGILFATKDGLIFQTNYAMEWLHGEIIDAPLRNAKELWENAKVKEEAIYRSDAPRIFQTADGRKWLFTRSLMNTEFEGIREIHAIDVTKEVERMEEEYHLLKDYQRKSRQSSDDGADEAGTDSFRIYHLMENDLEAAEHYLDADHNIAQAEALLAQWRTHMPT